MLSSCFRFDKNYDITFCEDQSASVSYISSAEGLQLLDSTGVAVPVFQNNLHFENEFGDSSDHFTIGSSTVSEVTTVTWQETDGQSFVFTLNCYQSSDACFSLNEGEINDIQWTPSDQNTPPASATFSLSFKTEMGQDRLLNGTFYFSAAQATVDLAEETCDIHCEDIDKGCESHYCENSDKYCEPSSCSDDRVCSYTCQRTVDGVISVMKGSFNYDPWPIISSEKNDLDAIDDYFSTSSATCNLNGVEADLQGFDLTVP